jgi:hypothetical protein
VQAILAAYHGEIGREATAAKIDAAFLSRAYHGEIGREATALVTIACSHLPAYHGEIGREATASALRASEDTAAYHGEIGREATAGDGRAWRCDAAYHGEIGREAPRQELALPARWAASARFGLSPGIQGGITVVPRWRAPLAPELGPPAPLCIALVTWTVCAAYAVAHDGGCCSLRPIHERASQPVAHDEVWRSVWPIDEHASQAVGHDEVGRAVLPDDESTSRAVSNFLSRCGQSRKHEQPSDNEAKMSVVHDWLFTNGATPIWFSLNPNAIYRASATLWATSGALSIDPAP